MRPLFVVVLSLSVASAAFAQDGGTLDAGSVDAGSVDAGSVDAGSGDAGSGDAGSGDAGSVDCEPRCEGDTLLFCEDEDSKALVMIDCIAELDASCGELSPEWGADCLLPTGAACTPGYADGASRCAGDACCIAEFAGEAGVCTAQSAGTDCRELEGAPAPVRPVIQGVDETDEELSSCLGIDCSNFPGLSLLPLFVALRLRRRRRS